jgi:hypothetical protein
MLKRRQSVKIRFSDSATLAREEPQHKKKQDIQYLLGQIKINEIEEEEK